MKQITMLVDVYSHQPGEGETEEREAKKKDNSCAGRI